MFNKLVALNEKLNRWSYPELRYFGTRKERRVLWKDYSHSPGVGERILYGGCIWVVFFVTWGFVGDHLEELGLPRIARMIVSGAVCGLFFGGLHYYLHNRTYRRYMRKRLQEQGLAICIPCGYNLRGQVEARCPECGERFDERLLRAGGHNSNWQSYVRLKRSWVNQGGT